MECHWWHCVCHISPGTPSSPWVILLPSTSAWARLHLIDDLDVWAGCRWEPLNPGGALSIDERLEAQEYNEAQLTPTKADHPFCPSSKQSQKNKKSSRSHQNYRSPNWSLPYQVHSVTEFLCDIQKKPKSQMWHKWSDPTKPTVRSDGKKRK